MYSCFFGLARYPFSMSPDADCIYATAAHREALSGLTYGILNRKGFVLLTGDAGMGKTTLCTRVIERLTTSKIQCTLVPNPILSPQEFLEWTLLKFGCTECPPTKVGKLIALQQFLAASHNEGKITVLIIDEAHKIPMETLEEIRLLGNLCSEGFPLLQVVLCGQNELVTLLNRDDLRQFKQRIGVRVSLAPLSAAEVSEYVRFRWTSAQPTCPFPFGPEALAEVARYSLGIPRLINSICDNALLIAFAEEQHSVTAEYIRETAQDLCLELDSPKPAATRPTAPAVMPVQLPAVPKVETFQVFEFSSFNRDATPGKPFLTRLARRIGFSQS
jgi:general secretion pathway protein A